MKSEYSLRFRLWCWWHNWKIHDLEEAFFKERETMIADWLRQWLMSIQEAKKHGSS